MLRHLMLSVCLFAFGAIVYYGWSFLSIRSSLHHATATEIVDRVRVSLESADYIRITPYEDGQPGRVRLIDDKSELRRLASLIGAASDPEDWAIAAVYSCRIDVYGDTRVTLNIAGGYMSVGNWGSNSRLVRMNDESVDELARLVGHLYVMNK